MPERIDYVESWAQRLRRRLYAQFRGAETWQQWCDEVLGPQFQDLEDATQSLLTLLDIDDSVGAQLDMIGRYVGQPRLALSDATYRLYLKARVLANKSTGTTEQIFSVMRALFESDAGPRYTGDWIKAFVLRISKVLTREEALVGVSFLKDAKESGARALLEWRESEDSALFKFDSATGFCLDDVTAGVPFSSLLVTTDVGGILYLSPNGGGVVLDPGTSREESFTYNRIDVPNSTIVFDTPQTSTYSHSSFETVVQSVSQTPVSGTGLDTGNLAGAKQA